MTTTPPPYNNLREYFRDVTLGFLILVGGMLAAEVMARPFRNVTDLAYPIALCIGMAPFWWFTRRCLLHQYDFYDYTALSVFMVFAMQLRELLGANQRMLEVVLGSIVFACYLGAWQWLRKKLRERKGLQPNLPEGP
jgi:hypothetical protein